MARDRANIRVDMLSNTDYRSLGLAAQHLYKLLLIHPTLTYAGVADWRPGRIATITAGVTAGDVRAAGKELQSGSYIYVDEDTEEVFIRSFVRHDGLLTRYRLPIAMANAYADISSPQIRKYFVHELKRMQEGFPTMECWNVERVKTLLKEPSEDMKAMVNSDGYSIGQPITYGMDYSISSDELTPGATSTPTATTTSTDVEGSGETPKKHRRNLPASWAPTSAHKEYANTEGISIDFQAESFRNHAEANDRKLVDWDAGFRNWLLKAERTIKKEIPHNPLWDP